MIRAVSTLPLEMPDKWDPPSAYEKLRGVAVEIDLMRDGRKITRVSRLRKVTSQVIWTEDGQIYTRAEPLAIRRIVEEKTRG